MFARTLVAALLVSIVNAAHSPEEWKSRTIYQVLTDRFAGPSTSSCDLHNYCGGTWNGLASKLNYISTLGFDAIWISPVIENTPDGYHGYWAKNLSAVNTNFGSPEDLKNLVKEAHQMGMWIMVDVVANHMGGVIGDINTFSPFNQNNHYHDCTGCDSNCDITDFNTLFSENCEHCRLAGLPDLNQDNSFVSSMLNTWIKSLVSDFNFDGIRVDTVPEVKPAFWHTFNEAAGCYAVGEVFNGDPKYVAPFQGAALDGILSYPMFFQIRNVFTGQQSFKQLQQLSDDMPNQFQDVTLLGTFVDNHDNVRFLNIKNDRTLYKNALIHVLFSSGIPIIYYGTEQGFSGGNDPECREILWSSNYDTTNDLYQFIKSAVGIRKEKSVWNLAYPQWFWSDDNVGVFSRGNNMLIATTNVGSNNDISKLIPLPGFSSGLKYCDVFDSNYCTTMSNGKLNIQLSGGMPRVLISQ